MDKLYASTAPPIVWARSTGLEVLNELDTFNAGILGAASGQSSTLSSLVFLWDTVARGVETVIGGLRLLRPWGVV
jgi:ubiquinone biosynthesis monooxygenase Coq6